MKRDPAAVIEAVDRAVLARGAAIMGVVNVTPDSFYDGGRHLSVEDACRRVDALIDEGADLLDIGGESTRPGSTPVPTGEQLERVLPAARHALERGALVSIDTADAEVAETLLELGARVLNDVSCLSDVELARSAVRHGAVLVVMHSRGPMSQMKGFSVYPEDGYGDVVKDVLEEWRSARDRATGQGLAREHVLFDPGLGFGKNARQSFELLARLAELAAAEPGPLVIGPSRKSFLAAGDGSPADARLGGTIAACLLAVERGARVLRVHDVHAVRQALEVRRAAAAPGVAP